MRTRLISLLAAGALVLSSFVIGSIPAQADDTTTSISGTVTLPPGHSFTGTNTVWASPDVGDVYSATVNMDGSYTIANVHPDTQYMVYVTPDNMTPNDLLTTFYGGYTMMGSPNPAGYSYGSYPMAFVSVAEDEQQTGVDITMVEGSILQGVVRMPDGTPFQQWRSAAGSVTCWHVGALDSSVDSRVDAYGDDNGTYSCPVVPGETYVIEAWFSSYPPTWLGGFAGWPQTLPNQNVDEVTAPPFKQVTSGLDITLVEPVTITGSVQPSSVVQNSSVTVFVCPTFPQDGQTSYPTLAARSGMAVTDPLAWCRNAVVPAGSDGTYSVRMTPGINYVVIGRAAGYDDTWHGGLVRNSSVFTAREGPAEYSELPPAGVVLVSGEAGTTVSGADVIFGDSVTVTYDSQGGTPVLDSFSMVKGSTVALPADPTKPGLILDGWFTQPEGGTPFTASTVVNADVTVYAQWSEPPTAKVVKQDVIASTTGGAARLANGTDSYTLVTTLTTGDGEPMLNQAGHLSATTSANVTVSGFTDNHNGTYGVTVASSVPGNYLVTVTLDGVQVGSPIPVNFIGADIAEPVRVLGDLQSAQGLGFLPGEDVVVTVHSDPINIGRVPANILGTVPVSFQVPKDFAQGRHTVEFAGTTSGTVTVDFSVVTSASGPAKSIQSGGMARSNGFLVLLSGTLIVAGLAVQRLRSPHITKRM